MDKHECTICLYDDSSYSGYEGMHLQYGAMTFNQCAASAVSRGMSFEQYIGQQGLIQKFRFCPYCGKQIDWDAIMVEGEKEVERLYEEKRKAEERYRKENPDIPF